MLKSEIAVRKPIDEGIVPPMLLQQISIFFNFTNDPIDVGRDPVRLSVCRDITVTDPLEHVIPPHVHTFVVGIPPTHIHPVLPRDDGLIAAAKSHIAAFVPFVFDIK